MIIPLRQQGKSVAMQRQAEAMLKAGKTVAFVSADKVEICNTHEYIHTVIDLPKLEYTIPYTPPPQDDISWRTPYSWYDLGVRSNGYSIIGDCVA